MEPNLNLSPAVENLKLEGQAICILSLSNDQVRVDTIVQGLS